MIATQAIEISRPLARPIPLAGLITFWRRRAGATSFDAVDLRPHNRCINSKISPSAGRRIARSRGYAISYEDAGEGFPLVLLPGYMQSAADYRQAGYVDRLAANRRVLVVDPLGHGLSDKPHEAEPYRSPGVAADVIAVMDAAGVEKAAIWGYSRGAWLACMTAIEFPERLSALILGGTALTQTPPRDIPAWVDALSRGDWVAFWSLFPIPLSPETRRHFEEVNDPKALAAERIGRLESGYVFDLGRVSAPTLIYCGGDDDPDDAVPTAQALGTQLHVLEGCDHFGAFSALDSVMPFASAFLNTAASG
jgi:pimeloyl-ACP methyl ester carboxylesterase